MHTTSWYDVFHWIISYAKISGRSSYIDLKKVHTLRLLRPINTNKIDEDNGKVTEFQYLILET